MRESFYNAVASYGRKGFQRVDRSIIPMRVTPNKAIAILNSVNNTSTTRRTPSLPPDSKTVHVGAADEHRGCTKRDALQHIRTSPDATIHEHRDAARNLRHDPRQCVEGRWRCIEVPRAVVGHDDAGDALLDSTRGVVGV